MRASASRPGSGDTSSTTTPAAAAAATGPAPPPVAGQYRVVYADPPWTFATYSRKGKGRSPEAHYGCMDLDAIKRLPVAEWAAADAVLLLWATDPLLDRALEVVRAWASPTRRWASTG